ncbi:hypothetical protein SS50377_21816 [Spironucleus salmonicida]|uniref:Uncharacterized protein n=1 Tax=Spironucleus salmonicida TaxID=348837 RepID=V6LM63_9EUKA|nr:hypothetical protein SS50377_21816 [Spironucleus salmonicida]|eukprot:EST44796.1 Hypothetical protein SS50377_15305 [Spironucleus salmonicida]
MSDYLTQQFDSMAHQKDLQNEINQLQEQENKNQDFLAQSQTSLDKLDLDKELEICNKITSPLRSQILSVHVSTNITRPSPKSRDDIENELFELQSQYLLAASQAAQSHAAAECAEYEFERNEKIQNMAQNIKNSEQIRICEEIGGTGEVVGGAEIIDVFECEGEEDM